MQRGTRTPCQLPDPPLWLAVDGRGSQKYGSRPRHEGSDVDVSDDHREELRSLVSHLGAGIRDTHYRPAYDAAANICSGIFDTIPVDLHGVVHEAAMAGYAAALSDLEVGKLDNQVRERSEIIE